VTMKNAVIWDVTPRGSYKHRRFGETYQRARKTVSRHSSDIQALSIEVHNRRPLESNQLHIEMCSSNTTYIFLSFIRNSSANKIPYHLRLYVVSIGVTLQRINFYLQQIRIQAKTY
jgi:hypothetical protein